jgi:hypothetical protein
MGAAIPALDGYFMQPSHSDIESFVRRGRRIRDMVRYGARFRRYREHAAATGKPRNGRGIRDMAGASASWINLVTWPEYPRHRRPCRLVLLDGADSVLKCSAYWCVVHGGEQQESTQAVIDFQ